MNREKSELGVSTIRLIRQAVEISFAHIKQ